MVCAYPTAKHPAAVARHESGFTLIELMVVLLIVAVLMAVAVPTFLGARNRAQNADAQASLIAAGDGAAAWWPDAQSFALPPGVTSSGAMLTTWAAGSQRYVGHAPSTKPYQVASARGAGEVLAGKLQPPQTLQMAALSRTGTCEHLLISWEVGAPLSTALGVPSPGQWWAATTGSPCAPLTAPPASGWHRRLIHAENALASAPRKES